MQFATSKVFPPSVIEYLWINLPLGKTAMLCGRDIVVAGGGSKACH